MWGDQGGRRGPCCRPLLMGLPRRLWGGGAGVCRRGRGCHGGMLWGKGVTIMELLSWTVVGRGSPTLGGGAEGGGSGGRQALHSSEHVGMRLAGQQPRLWRGSVSANRLAAHAARRHGSDPQPLSDWLAHAVGVLGGRCQQCIMGPQSPSQRVLNNQDDAMQCVIFAGSSGAWSRAMRVCVRSCRQRACHAVRRHTAASWGHGSGVHKRAHAADRAW